MDLQQREHIHAVMRLAGDRRPPDGMEPPDPLILDSWTRCVHQHGLDPTRLQEAVILPQQRVREHQERLDEFLRIARHGLEAMYQQVAGMGYCVLLTDARGVTVDFIGDLQLDATLRRAGLYLGSDWSEHHAGTCGVGTSIATGVIELLDETEYNEMFADVRDAIAKHKTAEKDERDRLQSIADEQAKATADALAAAERLRLAPDREKLSALLASIEAIKFPEIDKKFEDLLAKVDTDLQSAAGRIERCLLEMKNSEASI